MSISRRRFCEHVAVSSGLFAGVPLRIKNHPESLQGVMTAMETGSHIGNLYPFVQKQADRSPLELSFLRPEFRDLKRWQRRARTRLLEHLLYAPPPTEPQPQLIRRADRGDYIEEYLTFQTTPDLRVPAFVLIPKKTKLPAPGILALHSHDGIYLWGKEKLVETENEHP